MGQFKDYFSAHAQHYADARPHYPKALFEWIAAQCHERTLVWEAGCGNGQASTGLADHFDDVFASDPSVDQIALAGLHPKIHYAIEPAEQCSLADHTADCVCVAQALHWFEFERFFLEAKRVLKPGGLLAVWTYEYSSVNASVDAVFQNLYRGVLDDYWSPERVHVETAYRDIQFPFEDIASPRLQLRCDWRLSQYLAYLRSWSASQRYLKAAGQDPIAAIEAQMQQAWGTWAGSSRGDVAAHGEGRQALVKHYFQSIVRHDAP